VVPEDFLAYRAILGLAHSAQHTTRFFIASTGMIGSVASRIRGFDYFPEFCNRESKYDVLPL
jgi:hypothetical protein